MIQESKQQGTYHYFDTFDWRLYRQGYYLYLFNQYLYLYQFTKKKIEDREKYQYPSAEKFSLQDGIILRKITPIIDIRTLLCMATFRITNQSFQILNRDDKTVVRIQIEQSKIKDKTRYKNLSSYLEIQPLRGYANQVPGILKKLPLDDLLVSKDDLLKRGLATLGKMPADYSSKINIRLTNRMSALDATKQIYIYLLDIIRRNENGLIKDIDTEFLHDFRVSIRRTRSALGLRDIDVYLLGEQQYKLMLPVELRPYLNSFFEDLKEQRKIEHQSLVKTIKSVKYKRILSDWESYLKSEDIRNRQKVAPVRELAKNIIMKRNKKVLKFGQRVLITGSDELLHQLRIECKKLRYLLEFFNSLFSQEKIQYLVRKLKLLQDNLGDYNDLVIQQKRLIDSARDITPRTRSGKNTVLALGILIGKLNEKQQIIKKEFVKSFSGYAAQEVQKILDELFQVQERRVR
jgi:CHAD domain-containing protein